MTASPPVPPSHRHADRNGLPGWLAGSIAASAALAAGVAGQSAVQGRLTPAMGFAVGAGVAVLAVIGLPSLSIRLVARVVLLLSGIVLVRFGALGATLGSVGTGGQWLVLWVVAAVCVLVLSDRAGTDANQPLRAATGGAGVTRPAKVARTTGLVVLAVVLFAVLLAPVVLPHIGKAAQPGSGATLQPGRGDATSLQASSSLDMTNRPDLSDKVVFTVETDRATFWRGETFDVWDGRHWTRSRSDAVPVTDPGKPAPDPDDRGAAGDDVVEQRFRLEADYSDVIYAAPTAVSVDVDSPLRQVPGGTLLTAPLGRGATYTVESRRHSLTPERLRSLDGDEVPASVTQTYAQPPDTTARVKAAATEITADADTQYDKILAIEAWMGDRVEYSLDAPLAPKGVDVVDHFLFEAEQGWCEQIASSLVVLARANGIPARLATGFVPDDRDPITGIYDVRERDAHAWAEVWFPEIGWVPFDPTAHVNLAGSDQAKPTVLEWLVDHLVVIGIVVVAVVLLVGPVRALVRRRRKDRPGAGAAWGVQAERRLDALGRRVDRPRVGSETARAYATALALRYRDPLLIDVGRLIDDTIYASVPPDPDDEAAADALLAELEAGPDPEPLLPPPAEPGPASQPDGDPVRSG